MRTVGRTVQILGVNPGRQVPRALKLVVGTRDSTEANHITGGDVVLQVDVHPSAERLEHDRAEREDETNNETVYRFYTDLSVPFGTI